MEKIRRSVIIPIARDDSLLMLVEKDQDLAALERAGTYKAVISFLGVYSPFQAGH